VTKPTPTNALWSVRDLMSRFDLPAGNQSDITKWLDKRLPPTHSFNSGRGLTRLYEPGPAIEILSKHPAVVRREAARKRAEQSAKALQPSTPPLGLATELMRNAEERHAEALDRLKSIEQQITAQNRALLTSLETLSLTVACVAKELNIPAGA